MNLLTALYAHPEGLPPTLFAIGELSKVFDNIYVLHRPHLKNEWHYASNVAFIPSGQFMSPQQQEQSSAYKKFGFFLAFTWQLYRLIKKHKPVVVSLYDSMPLFSFYLIKKFIGYKPVVWYHNHDVIERKRLKKISIAKYAAAAEPKMFPYIDVFSLPSREREKYFPMNHLKGKYIFIPNFPSRKFYSKYTYVSKPKDCIKILFQGSIGPGHGIEELMDILPYKINGKPIRLVLLGPLKEPFKTELYKIINEKSIGGDIEIHGLISYKDVPEITSTCHIGIGIFTKDDIMNKTIATASNKIYEYIACGLPVLYYDDEYFRKHLSKYKWAVSTNLLKKSLLGSIEFIDSNYNELSDSARSDFSNKLNHEINFTKLSQELIRRIKEQNLAN